MFSQGVPESSSVVVVGGGIHGVGVAHDLVARGFDEVLLLEKSEIGAGTSRASTKLIHGGLRYLQRVRDFPLVRSALQERRLLMQLHSDLVEPCEFYFPILRSGGAPELMVRTGLALYDLLAGRQQGLTHRKVKVDEVLSTSPNLRMDLFSGFLSFWDAQTDDLALTRRVAYSAHKQGAKIVEGAKVVGISKEGGHPELTVSVGGSTRKVRCKTIVNCAGPWAGKLLEQASLESRYLGINNKGVHLIYPDMGLKKGLFLQSPEDGRIFFVLPWLGATLVGTTEGVYSEDPDSMQATRADIAYLEERFRRYFDVPDDFVPTDTFAGLRWLAAERGRSLSKTSRESVVEEHELGSGRILTLYGGKLTTYRKLSEKIGDQVLRHLGAWSPSKTDQEISWHKNREYEQASLQERFEQT